MAKSIKSKLRKKKKLPKATKSVDIRQNAVIKELKKDVNKLKGTVEVKEAPYSDSKAYAQGYIISGNITSSDAPTVLTPGRLIEQIGNGTLSMDRIGDKINIRSWYSKMRFQMLQSQFNSNVWAYPVDVRIIIARCITSSVPTLVTAPTYSVFSTLLKYDTASANQTSAPNNDFVRFNLPINTDDWKVAYDKKHRLLPLTLASTTGLAYPTAEKWAMMKGVKSHVDVVFDMKKHIGKVMKYTTASQADNYKQYFVFHIAIPSGVDTSYTTTSAGTSFLYYQTTERLKYTDS
jgi:hypothetical protein